RAIARLRVETVAFHEEGLERSRRSLAGHGSRSIAGGEGDGGSQTPAIEINGVAVLAESDARAPVRQMEVAPRGPDGERIRGIEAEEPDAGPPVALDIESHIQLGKG